MLRRVPSLLSAVVALALAGACADSPTSPAPTAAPVKAVAARSATAALTAADPFVDVSAGTNFSCGVRANGTLICWGNNDAGQLNVPAGTYKAVDASPFQNNVCAIRTDDALVCWGSPAENMTQAPAGTFKDVSMGLVHACAVRTDGSAVCWGRSFWSARNAPSGESFQKIAAGFEYSCGLKTDGFLRCWGGGGVGQTNPPNAQGPFTAISAGYTGSCAVKTNGEMACWGNRFGNEGVAPAGSNWVGVGGGAVGYCAVNSAGGIACGHTDYWTLFTNNAPAGSYVQVDMGGRHACGILQNGEVRCWSGDPNPLGFSLDVPPPPNNAPTATFSASSPVAEGSAIQLSVSSVVDEDAASVTFAFDCGTGFGAFSGATSAVCPTTDNGVRAVRATVKDAQGLTTTYSSIVTITNVRPTVNPFSGATIFAGEGYSATGTFKDPGADSWTGLVNYGFGTTPASVTDKSFALAYTYAAAGVYTVQLSIRDDDGGVGTQSATVTVLSPAAAAESMGPQLTDLVTSGEIAAKDATVLTNMATSAAASLASGNTTAGVNKLDAYINQVTALERSKRIDSTTANALRNTAERVKAAAGPGKKGK